MSKPNVTKRKLKRDLTDKQRAFILAYCANGFNGVRAAEAAGYRGEYRVLGVTASDLLKNPRIRSEIDKYFKQLAMGPDEVIIRLTEIARGDFADLLDDLGNFDFRLVKARGKSFLIKEQELTEKFIPQEGKDDIMIRTAKVKLHDAHAALNTLAKYHGLLTERLKMDDWRSEAVEGLRKGEIAPETAINVFGAELARELFALAGVKHDGA